MSGKRTTTSQNLKKLTSLSNSLDDNDLHNLEFLLTASVEGYREWQAQADDDDLDYAMELLIEYNLLIQEALCEVPFTQARKLLKSFTK
jgi:hypothetical protein